MTLARIRVTWSGSPVVGPGVSTFYQSTMADASGLAAIKSFYTSLAGMCPSGLSWTIPSTGDFLNESDGSLAGSWSFPGAGGVVAASTASTWVNGVGARIKWQTNGIHKGRKVVGATFMVPVVVGAYEGSGNLVGSYVTLLQSSANALVSGMGGDMYVWSRPTAGGGTDGKKSAVTAAQAPDYVSWLRSRRT